MTVKTDRHRAKRSKNERSEKKKKILKQIYNARITPLSLVRYILSLERGSWQEGEMERYKKRIGELCGI